MCDLTLEIFPPDLPDDAVLLRIQWES